MTETLFFYLVSSLMPALSLLACGLALSQIWKGHPRLPGRRKMLGAWALISAVCGHQILSRLAERYQGSFSAGAADGTYEAQMILPLPERETAVSRTRQVIRPSGSA